MNAKMKKSLANDALKYAINENDRRGYVPGHDGAVKDAYIAGFEARDKIAEEREARLVEALEKCTQAKWQWEDGHLTEHDCAKVAKKALANYKAEGDE